MNHRRSMLMAARGELTEILPYVPRIDPWFEAHAQAGTLPAQHVGQTLDELCRSEGWGLHKVIPNCIKVRGERDTIHWGLGVVSLKETVYDYVLPADIDVTVTNRGETTHVEYRTPKGTVHATCEYTEEMRRGGWTQKRVARPLIQRPEDYVPAAYIFENLEMVPSAEDFIRWSSDIGDDGLPVTFGMFAASPMHHIQKFLMDDATFQDHCRRYPRELAALAESLNPFFDQVLAIIADSPAEAVLWGSNFSDQLTPGPYFEREIVPWIRKAGGVLESRAKVLISHCDGENLGLLDAIKGSGMHVADAICPYPMTKVKIEDYYRSWSDRITIFGGIPSNLLIPEITPEEEFRAFVDNLFKAVAPGRRLILGVADSTPANASFDRLVRIGERVAHEGRLPF
jgi:hypothetical protein